jgi:hypothetical protein
MLKGYKAFNKGLICKGFQFEVGKEYEQKGNLKCCNNGFHLCENPLDVLDYYNLTESEFAEVEVLGDIDREENKIATNKIKIGAKLELPSFIKASFDFIYEKCKINKDDESVISNDERRSQVATSGHYSKVATSGESSQVDLQGEYSVGACVGCNNKIKGKKGNWITLAEWKYDNALNKYIPICVKSVQIDGKKIKEDTFYKLENKKFIEAGE